MKDFDVELQNWKSKLLFLTFFSLSIILVCCKQTASKKEKLSEPKETPVHKSYNPFSGKVFSFGPELDKRTCQSFGECDCCTYDLLFITDSTFVLIDRCVPGASYSKGSYILKDSSIVVTTDGVCINETIVFKDSTDFDSETIAYETEQIDPATTILKMDNCNGSVILRIEDDYGTFDRSISLGKTLKVLEKQGILQKLNLAYE